MINITNFIKSLKISWFRRLVNNSDNPWNYLFKNSVAPIDTISQQGNFKIKQLAQNSKNKFWQSALYALYDYISKISLEEPHNILNIPLWYNTNISDYPLYIKSWYNQGIKALGDVLDTDYNILSKEEIYQKYKVETDFFLHIFAYRKQYYLLKHNIEHLNNISYNRL